MMVWAFWCFSCSRSRGLFGLFTASRAAPCSTPSPPPPIAPRCPPCPRAASPGPVRLAERTAGEPEERAVGVPDGPPRDRSGRAWTRAEAGRRGHAKQLRPSAPTAFCRGQLELHFRPMRGGPRPSGDPKGNAGVSGPPTTV